MNTGVGGSADTRTQQVDELQRELVRKLHHGVLAEPAPVKVRSQADRTGDVVTLLAETALPINDPVAATCMPEAWARASMLIRLNSLVSGASGVQLSTVEALVQLLEKDVVPRIPIRSSISASGDLSPLSYIGGVMQGKPTLTVWVGDRSRGQRRIAKAHVALAECSIKPAKLRAKEGLAIVNGTAISAGVGALAIHEALCLSALSQILTAMSVEALCGTDESFDPFMAKIRPHPGQEESARNIFSFLEASKLVYRNDGSEESSLRQDRYSIRTASQWVGPVLEDLLLAYKQVMIECNSVTDNPLTDIQGGKILHGGNFQAKAITSAMEKTRQACQSIGRMLFAQCTELINPVTNRGLPPNLVVDEPSESFIWKGTDVMVAALASELGFLANPVGSHVQTAEMGNQSLNSLALISGRYTLDALEVLTQLSAAHLLALCQALDLRAMHIRFLEALNPDFQKMILEKFGTLMREGSQLETLQEVLWQVFRKRLDHTTSLDSAKRFTTAIESLQSPILRFIIPSTESLTALESWTESCSAVALHTFHTNKDHYFHHPDATPFLGAASARMYSFIRQRLAVPFLREDTLKTPNVELAEPNLLGEASGEPDVTSTPTVGSLITTIYSSIRNGGLYTVVMDCLREVGEKP